MGKKETVLLITGAIDIERHGVPFTRITDTHLRLGQYIGSLEYAIRTYRSIDGIIFAENTNFPYDYSALYSLAARHGKRLEVLPFEGNRVKTAFHGKGFGEMECIGHALDNSELLRASARFVKLTGRVRVLNFDCLLHSAYGTNSFYALSAATFPYVETILYRVDKHFFRKNLGDAGALVFEKEKMYLERVFFEKLYALKERHPVGSFRVYRLLQGLSASTGNSYATKLRHKISNSVFAALGRFDINRL
ncbi:MAG: hypothetical protein LBH72_00205 [Proteiniphilum sp.]|jgi:hypothetical protein|nr:hypothetical protein [Proteiniphilum sp.]